MAQLTHERTTQQWPDSVVRLAGAWSDFPEPEELSDVQAEDALREPL